MADNELPPDGFVDGHSGSELPPDGFLQADHPGNKFLDMVKQAALNMAPDNLGLQIGSRLIDSPSTPVKDVFGGLSDNMQGNPLTTAGQMADKGGEWVTDKLGQAFPRMGLPNVPAAVPATAGFLSQFLLNPTTWIGGAANPVGNAASKAGAGLEEATPEIMAKVANTSEAVAERMNVIKDLFKKFGGSDKDLETAAGNVQKALEEAITKYGQPLNEAKRAAGLPTKVMEKLGNLAQTGNVFGVAKTAVEGAESSSPASALAADIQGYLATHHLMPPVDKAKLASSLLDRINQEVQWGEHGDEVGGVFKDAYGHISKTLPEDLQAAKEEMSKALQVYGDLQKKLSEGTGTAQSWLEKVFESPDPAFKDYRDALAKLQVLTGKPVAENFLNQLAANRLHDSNWLNALKQSSLGLTGAVVSASFHHPLGAAISAGTALSMAGLRSPAMMSTALPALSQGLGEVGASKITPMLSGILASLANNQAPSKLQEATKQ